MKKVLQWLKANKVTVSGFITLLIFLLDELFNCIGFKTLPDTLYYFIITALYLFLGYSIKGRGLETIQQYEEIMKNKEKLGTKKTLKDILFTILHLLFQNDKIDHKEPTEIDQPTEKPREEVPKKTEDQVEPPENN